MSPITIWNVQSAVTCKSEPVPSRKSLYFGINKLILYFPDNFHMPCILLFTVYFHVPYAVYFTVHFQTVISMFLFLSYWLHSEANAVKQTIQLCLYQGFTIGQSFKRTSCNGWKWIAIQHTVNFNFVTLFLWGLCWRRCS